MAISGLSKGIANDLIKANFLLTARLLSVGVNVNLIKWFKFQNFFLLSIHF